jgi:DNA-directed RNA polymerase subunit M/transcription elongation factor TFIIS
MMIDCPKCDGKMKTTHNRRTGQGWYKRWQCKACKHYLSVRGEDVQELSADEIIERSAQGKRRRVSDADAIAIRLSTDPRKELAARYGISVEMVRQIQVGDVYQDLLPENFRRPPGPNDPSCERCREWRGLESADPCAMGFPDPQLEGVGFAQDCSLYEPRRC